MNTINITARIRYIENYIPPRCRKPRQRELSKHISLTLRQVTEDEAPVAFICNDYSHTHDIYDSPTIRLYKGKLYSIMKTAHNHCLNKGEENLPLKPEQIRLHPHYRCNSTLEVVVAAYKNAASKLLVIGEYVWHQCGEPRYVIMTFGLGHNHGGTGLSVDHSYNGNISKTRYFNALHGKEAIAEANRIAEARGDTKSVGTFKECIQVLIPEAVKCDPEKEHGDGDPFLNKLYKITESAKDPMTAGLLAIATTLKEI